jgi:hypothetical protein
VFVEVKQHTTSRFDRCPVTPALRADVVICTYTLADAERRS